MNGTASTVRNAVTSCAHTNKGMREKVMPGARSVKIVTMKLSAPRIDDRPMSWIARIQKVWPSPGENFAVVSGTYDVQPPAGRSP